MPNDVTTEQVHMSIEVSREPQPPEDKYRATCNLFPGVVVEADEHDEALYEATELFKVLLMVSCHADSVTVQSVTKRVDTEN